MIGSSTATYKRITFDNAIDQERSLPGWTQEYRQISPGAYSGTTAAIEYANVTVLRERINVRTEQMFSAPEGKLIFYFYYGSKTDDFVRGTPDVTNTGFAWDWIDRVGFMHPSSDLLMVVLDAQWLADAPPWSGCLRGEALERAGYAAEWLGSVLQVFGNPQGLGCAHEQLHAVLPDMIHDRLSMLYDDGDLAGTVRVDNTEVIYRRLRDQLHAAPGELLTVSALARAVQVPATVLRRVCREFTGTQLEHILVQLRLNGARRSLLEAEGEDRRVCDVAMDWGFMHWSRFAARYRQLFGETPSGTLRRSTQRRVDA